MAFQRENRRNPFAVQNPWLSSFQGNFVFSSSKESEVNNDEKDQSLSRLRSSGMKQAKRKANSFDGITVPSRKQLVTEERMAAYMQGLSLGNSDSNTPSLPSARSRSDDSDFEDCDDTPEQFDLTFKDDKSVSRLPRFEFAPGMRESFQNISPILPESILEKLINKPCLALVPYTPPVDAALNLILGSTDNEKNAKESSETKTSLVQTEEIMKDEAFMVEWDSDCDDDFLLD